MALSQLVVLHLLSHRRVLLDHAGCEAAHAISTIEYIESFLGLPLPFALGLALTLGALQLFRLLRHALPIFLALLMWLLQVAMKRRPALTP